MAGSDDVLSSLQNLAQAVNRMSQTWTRGLGNVTSSVISAQTLVTGSAGFLVSVTMLNVGGATGKIHNAATITAVDDTVNELFIIPTGGSTGVIPVGMVFSKGLVVSPGTSQVLVVTYAQGT